MLATSCVLPPDLSVADAGLNSPPAITGVRANDQELPDGAKIDVEVGANAGAMSVTLIDTDTSDTLYVRLFVDYRFDDPEPPRLPCPAAAPTSPPSVTRTTTCDLRALCSPEWVGREDYLFLAIQVFDRRPLADDGDLSSPMYKAMPEGGLTTSRGYQMRCGGSTL